MKVPIQAMFTLMNEYFWRDEFFVFLYYPIVVYQHHMIDTEPFHLIAEKDRDGDVRECVKQMTVAVVGGRSVAKAEMNSNWN